MHRAHLQLLALLSLLLVSAALSAAPWAPAEKGPPKPPLLTCRDGEEKATDVERTGEEPHYVWLRTDYCKPTGGSCGKGRHPVDEPVRIGSHRSVKHCEDGKPLAP